MISSHLTGHITVLAALSASAIFAVPAWAADYRIADQATYEKHRNGVFAPGDRILFKRGQRFTGQFAPRGSGTPQKPIIVDAYGEGAMPELGGDIVGERHNSGVITLANQSGWEFHNLAISNGRPGGKETGYRNGILFFANAPGTYRHFRIENCRFYDIFGPIAFSAGKDVGKFIGKHNGAVTFLISQEKGEVRVADLRIEHNDFDNVARQAITTRSVPFYTPGEQAFRTDPVGRFDNLYVGYNRVHRTAADSIMISNPAKAVIEHNLVTAVGQGWDKYDRRVPAWNGKPKWSRAPYNGLWAYNGHDVLIQHNEVSGISDDLDGTAYGVDRNSYGTVIQYNYSHNNSGGFFSTFGSASDTLVRGNISYNDHKRLFWFGFHETHDRFAIRFENNVFVTPPGEEITLFYGSNQYAPVFDRNWVVARGPVKWMFETGFPGRTGPKRHNVTPGLTTIESRGFEKGVVARNNSFSGFAELPVAGGGRLSALPDLPLEAPKGFDAALRAVEQASAGSGK
jgi:hypothetical protein